MSLTYAQYQTQMQDATAGLIPSMSTTQFNIMVPGMIDYAEQRIYRDLDLLTQITIDATGSFTPGSNLFTFPSHFVVAEQINVLSGGVRYPLTWTNRGAIYRLWPSTTGADIPTLVAPITDQQVIVGPYPSGGFTVEVVGIQRPTPLSAGNTTTFISQYLPDLFIAASMVYVSGYMRNFGSQMDDPQMSQSWETQYRTLLASAGGEEIRKKYHMVMAAPQAA